VVIKLFSKTSKFSENYLFEMLKCNEIIRERKFQILMKTHKLLASSQSTIGE
jgi:hypothetical protein